jgi:hypothetical protein
VGGRHFDFPGVSVAIVSEIRVDNFRSIKSIALRSLSDYEPIVGLNSAGKSNLLRALKLFFTGSVDEGNSPVSLDRDYSDYSPNRGRKIAVGLTFDLSGDMKYPRQDAFLKKHGILDSLAVQQSWSLDTQTRSITRVWAFGPDLDTLQHATDAGDVASLEAFVRAIDFRYVPNHARPSELIRAYVEPLRGALVSRLQKTKEYKSGDVGDLLLAMSRLADTLFSDVSAAVTDGIHGLTLKSDLPTDFADLAFDLAVRSVDSAGHARDPELEGSGTQQFMFLHLLDLADRTARGAGFGWLQGHLWAIEEPESFLHSGLRQRFATDLLMYSGDSRRQVLVTTHQDEFVRVGPSAVLAQSSTSSGTAFQRMPSKEALQKSTRLAITSYRHPLLQYPDQPLVLVEGKFDAEYLRAALSMTNIKPRWKLIDPDDLTGDDAGGDTFKAYLRYNAAAIASRPDAAPILVVRDWETRDVQTYKNNLKVHKYSTAVVMPESICNPELGKSWAGIERYLPKTYVETMVPPSDLLRRGDGVIETDKATLTSHKQALARGFDIKAHPSPHLVKLAEWIDAQVATMLDAVPTNAFL